MLFCLSLLMAGTASAAGGLLVPLYVWPTIDAATFNCISEDYTKLATSAAASQTIAIVNPYNGPNWSNDPWKKLSYDNCIKYLRDNDVEVIGYVHTKLGYPHIYGYRDPADIKADIDSWNNDYDVDGIFIDEVSGRWPDSWDSKEQIISFNTDLVEYVLASFDRAVMNMGGPYFEELMTPYSGNSKVIAVVFEGMQWNYMRENCVWSLWTTVKGSFERGPWCNYVPEWDGVEPLKAVMDDKTIPSDQSAVLIYGSPADTAKVAEAVTLGKAANVGWFYVTDQWGWSATPSQPVLDTLAEAVMSA